MLSVCYVYRVNHSKNAIVKPQGPTPQEERKEVEEAMKRIKEANQAIAKALDVDPKAVAGELRAEVRREMEK